MVVAMAGPAAAIGCVSCCLLGPLSVFTFFWWLKGNFDVWGTFPRTDISFQESIA